MNPFKIFNVFNYGLTGLFLFLDGLVYTIVSKMFSIFVAIAGAEIITGAVYEAILRKIEVVIGVFALFYLAYALLKSIVNPDEMTKTTSQLAKNFIIALVLISVVPVIFTYAFKFQNIVVGENKIGVLLLGDNSDSNMVETVGNTAALSVLEAFLYVPAKTESLKFINGQTMTWLQLENIIKAGGTVGFMGIVQWVEPIHNNYCAAESVNNNSDSNNNGNNTVQDDCVSYTPIISTICGCFMVYILISFSLDLGVRVFKLAFYQIIAPIPIMMYILPEKKSLLENWSKKTLAVYLEVFIRIFVMYVVIFFISVVITAYKGGSSFNTTSEINSNNALATEYRNDAFENRYIALANLSKSKDSVNLNKTTKDAESMNLVVTYKNEESNLETTNNKRVILLAESESETENEGLRLKATSGDIGAFGLVFLILGLMSFLKIAPKMLTEILGIDSASIKLGIRQKLKDGGGFIAGAAIGGGLTTGTRNLTRGFMNAVNARGAKDTWKAIGRMFTSAGAGAVSGAARSGYGARNAGNFGEMRTATRTGINNAIERRYRRESYRESHGGTLAGAFDGHVSDFGRNIMDWAGVRPPIDQLRTQQNAINEINTKRNAVDERVKSILEREKNERLASSSINVDGTIMGYNNLADLERDIKYLEEHGEILDEHGHQILSRNDLRAMNKAKVDLTNRLKQDILQGRNKDGTNVDAAGHVTDITEYDAELRNTVADLRNTMSRNYSALSQYADTRIGRVSDAMGRAQDAAIVRRDQRAEDFLLDGAAWDLFNTQHAIFNASGRVNEEITNSIQRNNGQSGNSGNGSGS